MTVTQCDAKAHLAQFCSAIFTRVFCMAADFATLICYYLQDYEAMLEESKDLKPGFRYSQARTLFEDDPRWKVTKIDLMWQTCAHKGISPSYHDLLLHFLHLESVP